MICQFTQNSILISLKKITDSWRMTQASHCRESRIRSQEIERQIVNIAFNIFATYITYENEYRILLQRAGKAFASSDICSRLRLISKKKNCLTPDCKHSGKFAQKNFVQSSLLFSDQLFYEFAFFSFEKICSFKTKNRLDSKLQIICVSKLYAR